MRKVASIAVLGALMVAAPSSAFAGGCAPGDPCWEDPTPVPPPRQAPVAPKPAPVVEPEPMPEPEPMAEVVEESGELNVLLSGGVNVMFWDCEDTKVGPGFYVDVKHDDVPLNVRAGVEGYDLEDSEQYKFNPDSRYFQEEPDFVVIRMPLSVEYALGLGEKSEVLLGGGPDLLVLSGEQSDTSVGFHLGARFRQSITDALGFSVGGGYMWGEGDLSAGEKYDLDSAFVGADLSFRF